MNKAQQARVGAAKKSAALNVDLKTNERVLDDKMQDIAVKEASANAKVVQAIAKAKEMQEISKLNAQAEISKAEHAEKEKTVETAAETRDMTAVERAEASMKKYSHDARLHHNHHHHHHHISWPSLALTTFTSPSSLLYVL